MACGQTPLDLIECEVYTVGRARQLISCRLTAYITWDYIRAAALQTWGFRKRKREVCSRFVDRTRFHPRHVLSSAADMNRHHYSLYVHNCRLILLLRQEPTEAENYKPAEFHWKLDQVWRQALRFKRARLVAFQRF